MKDMMNACVMELIKAVVACLEELALVPGETATVAAPGSFHRASLFEISRSGVTSCHHRFNYAISYYVDSYIISPILIVGKKKF